MKKYKTEFKLEVVQSFLAAEGGAKLLARRWSIPEEKIRTWVSHYRLHGIDGLRPKRSVYSAQFKLQVLSHQDHEQLSSRQVAAIYDIRNPNQVVVWRRNLNQGGVGGHGREPGGRRVEVVGAVVETHDPVELARPGGHDEDRAAVALALDETEMQCEKSVSCVKWKE